MIRIVFNGVEHQLSETITLSTLTEKFAPKEQKFAVAVNEQFVPKSLYEETSVQDGDTIELLTPMVGG
ncbi:sulfur carrier protein ThiS [Marinibactrum halimedae]|uniref:Sulfur carrier protein ThiS n=1 Tax=Marinibactrum halimedae TaxID=1444977 RepID=A0AA37T9F3_9GAMM|nr:sulfur carrier protein ThiS [Marinibactrum halimedae]MCD9458689.1 sulfur carrier protein ThiS [Marinibactrum halimedae]GLS25945.1 hypothetical protein GCM10007877_16600 [Marinibactrum halimedae]